MAYDRYPSREQRSNQPQVVSNEPRYVRITAAWLALQRNENEAALARRLGQNYDRLFGV